MTEQENATIEKVDFKRYFLLPVIVLIRIIVLPLNLLAWLIETIKRRRYDPEKDVCPGCGFRGDSGTNGKTCRVEHFPTAGPEKAVNRHVCFRCGADHFTNLFLPAEKWVMKEWLSDRLKRTPMKVQERPAWPIAR